MCCPSRWYGRMQNMTLYKYHSLLKNKPLLKYPSLPTATLPWTGHLLSDWTVFPQSQIPLYGRRANSSSLQKMCFVKITPSQMSGPSCRDAPEPRLSGGRDTETFCHEGCRDRSSEQPEEYSSTQQFLIRNQAGDVRQQLLRRAWKQRDSQVWKKRREESVGNSSQSSDDGTRRFASSTIHSMVQCLKRFSVVSIVAILHIWKEKKLPSAKQNNEWIMLKILVGSWWGVLEVERV